MIEEFFKAHQHTIAAIAAAGTFGAVVTSLWLAWRTRREDRTKLKAVARVELIARTHNNIDGADVPRLLTVSITNQGKWPLRIPANFFYWKMPFKRAVWVIPLDLPTYMSVPSRPLDLTDNSPWIAKKKYPTEVAPRTSENFYISNLPTLRQDAKKRPDTFADRLRFRLIKVYVETDDGETFRVRLSPVVRRAIGRMIG
jgi:hypothetical protein